MRGATKRHAPPPNQHFRSRSDIRHQVRRRLKIPVGMRDIDVTEIGRQSNKVPSDRLALGAALFQRSSRKGMPKIVDARAAAAVRRDICARRRPKERAAHREWASASPSIDGSGDHKSRQSDAGVASRYDRAPRRRSGEAARAGSCGTWFLGFAECRPAAHRRTSDRLPRTPAGPLRQSSPNSTT